MIPNVWSGMRDAIPALNRGGPFPNTPCLREVWNDTGFATLFSASVHSAGMTHLLLSDAGTDFRLGPQTCSPSYGLVRYSLRVLALEIWYVRRPVPNGVTPAKQPGVRFLVVMRHLRWLHLRFYGKLGYLKDGIKAPVVPLPVLPYGASTKARNCYCSFAYFVPHSSLNLKTVRLEGFLVPLKDLVHGVEPLA
jgi:hypothetical protein